MPRTRISEGPGAGCRRLQRHQQVHMGRDVRRRPVVMEVVLLMGRNGTTTLTCQHQTCIRLGISPRLRVAESWLKVPAGVARVLAPCKMGGRVRAAVQQWWQADSKGACLHATA